MKRRRKKIGWTFSFAKMNPVLKAILTIAVGFATAGYIIIGSWMVYVLMTK